MSTGPAIVISGTSPYSLGASLLHELGRDYQKSPIVAIDKRDNPIIKEFGSVYSINLDLNPLESLNSYDRLTDKLKSAILDARSELGFMGIGTAILSAGIYDSGRLVDSSIEARKRIIGCNICGKIELLHSLLWINRTLGFTSSDSLTLIDIGSLHGLTSSGGRSLYAATKAFGLDLCLSLYRGREVKRVIHLALGAMDTHMLHRNHWVTKEGGSSEFFEYALSQNSSIYEDIFVRCDTDAFAKTVSLFSKTKNELEEVFTRYKVRRVNQFNDEEGVLRAEEVAHQIVEFLTDEKSFSDGVYILTAPTGRIRMKKLSFHEAMRYHANKDSGN